jgi:nicotinamidase-related amidase
MDANPKQTLGDRIRQRRTEAGLTLEQLSSKLKIEGHLAKGLSVQHLSEVERGADTVVVCGIATDSCVLATAIDLFEYGLRPIVVKDACGSHAGRKAHEAGLFIIERFIGSKQLVMSSDLLSEEWTSEPKSFPAAT